MEELCRICGEVLNEDNGHEIIKVSQEHAIENIRKSAELRGLEWSCLANKGDRFHVDCRKEFTKNDKIKPVRVLQNSKPKTRNDSNQAHHYPQLENLTIALVACFVLKLCASNMLMIMDIVSSNLKSIL